MAKTISSPIVPSHLIPSKFTDFLQILPLFMHEEHTIKKNTNKKLKFWESYTLFRCQGYVLLYTSVWIICKCRVNGDEGYRFHVMMPMATNFNAIGREVHAAIVVISQTIITSTNVAAREQETQR